MTFKPLAGLVIFGDLLKELWVRFLIKYKNSCLGTKVI